MVAKFIRKVFGSRNDRLVKRMQKTVSLINSLEEKMSLLDVADYPGKTQEFRNRLQQGETLDQILPEAFALVRCAGENIMGMRHFDVQLIGGMVLNQGKIAEMRTGEGKTLVATLAAYLNALPGKGVHVVTVNDYLARRDASWMGPLYSALGLSVGVIQSSSGMGPDQSSFLYDADAREDQSGYQGLRRATRREAYHADITYGTNNEFGFDYLRDNMAFSAKERTQRKPFYAIVDEVDSILIDEARTPLIISGPTDDNTELYQKIDAIIPRLERQPPVVNDEGQPDFGPGDYSVDEKARQVYLSDDGHQKVEELLSDMGLLLEGQSLYDTANILLMHHVMASLRAHAIFQKNVDYIVKDGEIIIVDEFTGRTMPGRRWSDGLHQAVEAKERVRIQPENQTLASITFQNYFRLYPKLSGMTGTADTEAYEFQQIYGLEVVVIPTNRAMIRNDMGDLVYLTQKEKYQAIIEDIQDCVKRGQPVLVGTASIEASELVSRTLEEKGIAHQVLNAKQHEREARIIVEAGRPGVVTIATNMAGRGTDIVLGGNLEAELKELPKGTDEQTIASLREQWQENHRRVLEAGGLHVIGTERHESRRIDNQLRGRSGRQGDPGSSRFYLSLEDNLMRIFASERVSTLMQKLGMQEGEAIEHPWVSRAIENAQRKVEGRNFDIRKQLLEYDDVANDQRKVVYGQRNELMEVDDISETIVAMREDVLKSLFQGFIPPGSIDEQWDIEGLEQALAEQFGDQWPIAQWLQQDHELHEDTLLLKIREQLASSVQEKERVVSAAAMRDFEKAVMLQTLDSLWKEHLAAMDYLRQGIHLRGYAQKNPKQEYKREAFEMFSAMLEDLKREVTSVIAKVKVKTAEEIELERRAAALAQEFEFKHETFAGFGKGEEAAPDSSVGDHPTVADEHPEQTPFKREQRKVGRNEPCPCGSGKKYKQCCGKLA